MQIARICVRHVHRKVIEASPYAEHVGFVAIASTEVFHLASMTWYVSLFLMLSGLGAVIYERENKKNERNKTESGDRVEYRATAPVREWRGQRALINQIHGSMASVTFDNKVLGTGMPDLVNLVRVGDEKFGLGEAIQSRADPKITGTNRRRH